MAKVDYSEGVPSVAPQGSAPDDYQHIQSNPNEFGGAIAQGAEKLGAGLSQAGKFWGQIQTDGMQNDANQEATGIVENFKKLNGQDALNAQKETQSALDKAYNDRRGKLATAEQQYQFDQQTRSFRQRFLDPQIWSHANQQGAAYAKDVNEGTYKQALDILAANPDDPEKSEAAMHMATVAAGKIAHLHLGESATDEDADLMMRPYLQGAYKTQAQALAVKDPVGAVKFLDDNKDRIGADYAALSAQFRSRANEQQALGVADHAFTTTAQTLQNPTVTGTMAVREAILQQESGNRDTATTSTNGAVGPGQIMRGTFAQYAKPGEDIANPADNRAVSSRIVDDLSQKYGGDPARIAVGYFSGPGNVAPIGSPTPWIKDIPDANGKSVSSYVQDVTQRVGSQGTLLAARAGVYDKIMAATEGNPQVRQAALREVDQRYRAAEISDLQDQKARRDAQNTALRGYGDAIADGKPVNPRSDPNLTEEQVEHIENLQRESLSGQKGGYGPGYADVQTRLFSNGPDAIHNQEQLLLLAHNGQLTAGGFKEASNQLAEVNKPGAEADRVLSSNFYASARHAVTLEYEGEKDTIPGSGAKWNAALPALNQALAAGRAKGLTNQQLMDPENKNSVWPILKPWMPTPNEKKAAEINKDAHAAAAAVDWQTINKKDDAVGAYERHEITRDQARILWDRNGWGKKTEVAPQVPVQ